MEETHKLSEQQFEDIMSCLMKLKNFKEMEARKCLARAKQNDFRWGDSNSSYFHRIANGRKKRNTIVKLDIDMIECFDQDRIKVEMRNYYADLFTENSDVIFFIG